MNQDYQDKRRGVGGIYVYGCIRVDTCRPAGAFIISIHVLLYTCRPAGAEEGEMRRAILQDGRGNPAPTRGLGAGGEIARLQSAPTTQGRNCLNQDGQDKRREGWGVYTRIFFEPGFSGLEVGGIGVRFIEGKVPFCQGILKYKLLSCKSCNPENHGSDN